MMIFGVGLEVFGQVVDAFAENGDLHFRRPGVGFVRLVAANQLGLAIFGQRHTLFLHERSRTGWWLNGLPPARNRTRRIFRSLATPWSKNLLVEQAQHVTPEQPRDAKAQAPRPARRRRGAGRPRS